jgi:hypothetical protein
MAGSTTPATFTDAMSKVASDLGAAIMLPDADVKFGMTLLSAITGWGKTQGRSGPGAGPAAGPPGAKPPGRGGPGGPPGGPGAGGPPGLQMPGAGAGASPVNPHMPNLQAPTPGPQPGGLTPGLSPNPDEMRRVIQQVTS